MIVGDAEFNGLNPTVCHCAVFKDTESGKFYEFSPISQYSVEKIPAFLGKCETLCMHNGIGYDWFAIKQTLGYEYAGKLIDTLVMSRVLFPDRLGGHSVEAWAKKLGGEQKVENEDWSEFSENMLIRCRSDVNIQEQIYNYLLKEMGDG